LYLRSK